MQIALLILAEFLIISCLILLLFKMRSRIGLAPLYIFIGSMQYLQTILSSYFYIEIFADYSISPGSILLFSSSLFAVLLVYIYEGVFSTRALIFGIVISNVALTLITVVTHLQEPLLLNQDGIKTMLPDIFELNYKAFVVGTITLIFDFFLIVVLYKFLITKITRLGLPFILVFSLSVTLWFDAIVFTSFTYHQSPLYDKILISQLVGKSLAAVLFGLMLYLYYRYCENHYNGPVPFVVDESEDIFSILRYRKKFMALRIEMEENEKKLFARWENTLNTMQDAFITMDWNLGVTYVNKRAAEMFQIATVDYADVYLSRILPEDAYSELFEACHNAIKTKEQVFFEAFYKKEAKWLESYVYPTHDGLSVFLRDITLRKEAFEKFKKEKIFSDSIINSLPGVFYFFNKDGKFISWNKNFETVSGYTSAEIKKMHPLDFFDVQEKSLITERIGQVFDTGEAEVEAYFYTKTKEKIAYLFNGRIIVSDGVPCLLGLGINIEKRKLAESEFEKANSQLRKLTIHLQNIREEERKRIGREIHDDLGQQLTAIKMDVSWIAKKSTDPSPLVTAKLDNIIRLLDSSSKSVRRILKELRLGILENYGLKDALKWLSDQFAESGSIQVTFSSGDIPDHFPEEIEVCIFRVFQESLTNIIKYAESRQVSARLQVRGEMVEFIIRDDGIGFDLAVLNDKQTFGILGMKERVAFLDGSFSIDSNPGKGTVIFIRIPLHAKHDSV